MKRESVYFANTEGALLGQDGEFTDSLPRAKFFDTPDHTIIELATALNLYPVKVRAIGTTGKLAIKPLALLFSTKAATKVAAAVLPFVTPMAC